MKFTRRRFLSSAGAAVVWLACSCAFGQFGASLVPPASATDVACASGSWQDTATWSDGTVPISGEKVYIPPGLTVTNNGTTADVLWIHVAGALAACDHCDTQLNVHTLYVPMGGNLDYGSVGMPRTGKATTEFLPGPFLPGDWQKLSRGLICHGELTACGNEKTAWDIVDGDLAVGATSVVLQNVPFGWKAGDQIIVAGTTSDAVKYQTEQRVIVSVSGRTVTFSPALTFAHARPRADLPFHCANITRNIVFRSRDTSTIENRGHLMFMSPAIDVRYIAVEGCGRTDALNPVTDPRNDIYGQFVVGSDANPRARYPIHWHRVGSMNPPASARGVVVNGSPKWGFVNHASNVHVDECICVNYVGSGFSTEEGQERGHFRRCLATGGRGQGDTISSTDSDHGRDQIGDWGTDGAGFWLQGPTVEVSDCVSFDNSGRGFALFNRCLNSYPDYNSVSTPDYLRFPIDVNKALLTAEYLTTPWWVFNTTQANPKVDLQGIASSYVPFRTFRNNTAYNCKLGLQSWDATATPILASRVAWPEKVLANLSNVTLWGRGAICHLEYTRQMNIDGLLTIPPAGTNPPTLQLRRAEITVKNYRTSSSNPLNDAGTAAEKATHSVTQLAL